MTDVMCPHCPNIVNMNDATCPSCGEVISTFKASVFDALNWCKKNERDFLNNDAEFIATELQRYIEDVEDHPIQSIINFVKLYMICNKKELTHD